MGAGTNSTTTTTVVCTQSAQILPSTKLPSSPSSSSTTTATKPTRSALNKSTTTTTTDTEYDSNVSTITTNEKDAIAKVLSELNTHGDELNKLKEIGAHQPILPSQIGTDFSFKRVIVWKNAIGFAVLHALGGVGLGMMALGICDIRTSIYIGVLGILFGQGVTMGAHRLWSHRAYKAKRWLKIVLLTLHTTAGQNCLWVWVRDHRQHHKYSDTDADPHNANRGFFFSHIGWLMSRKHPKVLEYGNRIDMSDLEADPWIMFQKEHYKVLYTIFSFFLPTFLPVYFWNEDPIIAIFTAFIARTILVLNVTWCVNSVAHLYGTRPYDSTILPVENAVLSIFASGEGWHNYHHAFPWDYRASELGTPFNITGALIDLMAKFGQVYDLKEATHTMVKNRVMRTGDESHHTYGTDQGRKATKTLFNIFNHPLNPTYNSIHKPLPKVIAHNGYALIQNELKKDELDDTILAQENERMVQKQKDDLNCQNNIQKYIVDKREADKYMNGLAKYFADENMAGGASDENISEDMELTINNNVRERIIGKH